MNPEEIDKILSSIPEEEPRSNLEPYRELILRLRREGRAYRKIRKILAERLGVNVSYSALYQFIQRRSRGKQNRSTPVEALDTGDGKQKAIKKPMAVAPVSEEFVYDPDRPPTNKNYGKEKG